MSLESPPMASTAGNEIVDPKHCWVCFLSEDDVIGNEQDVAIAGTGDEQDWVKPCKCRGTAKWVHQSCLQRWIDEKQKSTSGTFCN